MKSRIKQLVIYVVILAVLIPLGFVTKLFSLADLKDITFDISKFWKLLIVVFLVLAIENIVSMILGSFNPKNQRARSVLSIAISLLKYLAFIVILCGDLRYWESKFPPS